MTPPAASQIRRSSMPQTTKRSRLRIEKPEIPPAPPPSYFGIKVLIAFSFLFSVLSLAVFLHAYFAGKS